jgi:UDP-glucose 4-epimerase
LIEVKGDKFIVTGGAGFIGSHICEELDNQGKELICLDSEEGDDFPTEVIDLSKHCKTKLDKLFKGVDVVFHNAASKCTVCREDPLKDLMTNAWGSFQIFQAAAEHGAKVVHASTGSVYGECDKQEENIQYAPKSYYGVSKLAGEQYLRCFPGLRWVGLRYFHVYGPRQNSSDKGGVIPIFITKMLNNSPITVYGDGEQTRSFTYVKDVVSANFVAANRERMEGRFFNVASGAKVTLNWLIDYLREKTGSTSEVAYEDEREGDIKDFTVSNRRIREQGVEFSPLGEGIKETIRYYANS